MYPFTLFILYFRFILLDLFANFFQSDRLDQDKKRCFIHESMFHGVNFPADGPIMKKETTGWDPSFEKMTACDGTLRGDVTMFLLLKGGGYHKCQFHTTYK